MQSYAADLSWFFVNRSGPGSVTAITTKHVRMETDDGRSDRNADVRYARLLRCARLYQRPYHAEAQGQDAPIHTVPRQRALAPRAGTRRRPQLSQLPHWPPPLSNVGRRPFSTFERRQADPRQRGPAAPARAGL